MPSDEASQNAGQPESGRAGPSDVARLETLVGELRAENARLVGAAASALAEAERARQRSEAELAFVLTLDDALRQQDDPIQVQATAARLLGERLQADRVFYGEIAVPDGVATCVIERDYHRPGLSSLTGRFAFDSFSHTDYASYQAGRAVTCVDVAADGRDARQSDAYRAIGVAAYLGIPLHEHGQLVGVLGVLHQQPRDWTPEDIRLTEQTAGRTWHAVQRARAEKALRESEQRFRLVLAQSPITVAMVDRDLRYTWIYNLAIDLRPEDVIGKTLGLALPPQDREPLLVAARGVVETGQPAQVEMTTPIAQGSRTFRSHVEPLRDTEGGIVGAALVSIDLTNRKRAEEALQRANAALAEADRRKNEFIAVLSHELRNPLAPIRYALPLLAEERLGEGGRRATAVIDRQVTQLARLVDDLLDVSRITSGKIELRRDYLTLSSVLAAAAEAASPAIVAARHGFEIDIPEAPVWLHVDGARVAQAVTNLLNNSAKYTPPGGRIRLDARAHEGRALIRVVDNGIGIAPDALGRVFEMFRQVSDPRKKQGGLGVGLTLARQFVELHGGSIEARSGGEGLGCEFVISLPLAQVDARPDEPQLPTPFGQAARLRVLVVDDNVDLVDMLATVIECGGHQVRKAFDGPSAVAAALEFRPHVVLLDVGMPGMNGIDVAHALRGHPTLAKTTVVALTGWGQAEDRRRTREAGFDDHLTKPAEPREIQRILAAVANRIAAARHA
jgi:PAS domain S-box-containing protein